MPQTLLPMPLPVAETRSSCGRDAVVMWFLAEGGTVCACESHRLEMVSGTDPDQPRAFVFRDFALLRPGRAKCEHRAP